MAPSTLLLAGLFGVGLALVGAGLVYALHSIAELKRAVRSMRVEEQSLLVGDPAKQVALVSALRPFPPATTEEADVEQQAIETPRAVGNDNDNRSTNEEEEEDTIKVLPLISGLLYIEVEDEDKGRKSPRKKTPFAEERRWPSDGPVTPPASSSQLFLMY
ncbi:hypothetical protein BASA81_006812 [Batrachochytrium salamandrivorans]|nr:hypothetical protein BASA81_006812 [Batrachochytrium salamandrivorans]